jgi:hypothetical protein
MTIEDLIKAGKNQVRNNSNLMSAYIDLFTEKFGRKPDCAGCTFNVDWNRLTNSNIQNTEIMSDKTFRLKNNAVIYSYDVEDKKLKRIIRKRAYGNVMTEEFAENFLTHGTAQQIADRKKQFAVLPKKFIESEEVDLSKKKIDELKALAIEKEFPKEEWESLKKDELVAYVNAKFIESEEVE